MFHHPACAMFCLERPMGPMGSPIFRKPLFKCDWILYWVRKKWILSHTWVAVMWNHMVNKDIYKYENVKTMRTWSKNRISRISTDLTFANSSARSNDLKGSPGHRIRPSCTCRAGGYPTPWALQRSCSDAGCPWILRSDSDPVVPSGHTRLQTSNKPCSTMQKVAPEPIQKVEMCWNHLKSSKIPEFLLVSPQRNKQNSSWCSSELNFFRSKLGRFASGASLSSSSSSSSRLMVLSWAAWRTSWRKRRTWRSDAVRYHGWPDDIPVETPTKIVKYTVYSEVLEVLCIL